MRPIIAPTQRIFLTLSFVALLPAQAQEVVTPKLQRRSFDAEFKPCGPQIKVAFLDADSTLRVSRSGSPSANNANDVVILPNVAKTIARLATDCYLVAIVSNQGGIPRFISLENADAALSKTRELILKENARARIHYHDFAEFDDADRKPEIGMGLRLEAAIKAHYGSEYSLDKTRSFMVGDSAYKKASGNRPGDLRPDGRRGFDFSNSDRLFAEKYEIPFIEPHIYFNWIADSVERFNDLEEVLNYWKKKAGTCDNPLQ